MNPIAASSASVGVRRAARCGLVALVVLLIRAWGLAAAGATFRAGQSRLDAGLVLEAGGGPQAPCGRG